MQDLSYRVLLRRLAVDKENHYSFASCQNWGNVALSGSCPYVILEWAFRKPYGSPT